MIQQLLADIRAYFEWLQQEWGDYAAFHNYKIPLEGYVANLAPYYINRHPYCLYVKSNSDAWAHCMERLPALAPRCAEGAFCGICYAGVGEMVFPVRDLDNTVLGFISVSGYEIDEREEEEKARHFADKYHMDLAKLQTIRQTTFRKPADKKALQVRVAPLCNMFVLLYHALLSIIPQGMELRRESSLLSHAVWFLQKNYCSDIKISDVAAYCHCSASTISHLFKRQMGQSVPAYLQTLRLNNAKRLLAETDLSVSAIADAVGFCTANYFCTSFKQETGCSPSAWRSGQGHNAARKDVFCP